MALETREDIERRIKESARRIFKKNAPVEGTYEFAILGAVKQEQPAKGDRDGNGAGCVNVAVRAAPMATPGDLSTVKHHLETTVWLLLPIVNPEVEGHVPDRTATNRSTALLSAFFPERVEYVSKKLGDGSWDNSPETKARINAAQVEAAVLATEIYENVQADRSIPMLKDRTFVASTELAPEGKGYYTNGIASKLLPGKEFGELKEASN